MGHPIYIAELFAGGCGLGEGLRLGLGRRDARTIFVVEREAFACAYLAHQMEEGRLDACPIFTDVTSIPSEPIESLRKLARRAPLWFCAGFPCQDISPAGKGKGLKGKRSGLWFNLLDRIRKVQPGWLLLENVSAIRTRGLETVIEGLAQAGYDAAWCCLQASEVGTPHKRERWFCLARLGEADDYELRGGKTSWEERQFLEYAPGKREREPDDEACSESWEWTWTDISGRCHRVLPEFPPGRDDPRWEQITRERPDLCPALSEAELAVRSVVDGLAPDPTARLALCRVGGNGVVPQQAAFAVRILLNQLEGVI